MRGGWPGDALAWLTPDHCDEAIFVHRVIVPAERPNALVQGLGEVHVGGGRAGAEGSLLFGFDKLSEFVVVAPRLERLHQGVEPLQAGGERESVIGST